jgi:hypothetical protein
MIAGLGTYVFLPSNGRHLQVSLGSSRQLQATETRLIRNNLYTNIAFLVLKFILYLYQDLPI